MKIIFLDLDGVLIPPGHAEFASGPVARLKHLIKKHFAKVVLHSSWRLDVRYRNRFQELWDASGFEAADFIGFAAPEFVVSRDLAVRRWLHCNGMPDAYVILDDENYSGFDQSRLVQTFAYLNDEDATKADKILDTPLP